MSDRVLQSDYMHFAKYQADARYNLATSGVAACELADLGLTMDDLALHGVNAGGYRPLMEKVAARFGVDPACVVMPGGGCSFANHLALASIVFSSTVRPVKAALWTQSIKQRCFWSAREQP